MNMDEGLPTNTERTYEEQLSYGCKAGSTGMISLVWLGLHYGGTSIPSIISKLSF